MTEPQISDEIAEIGAAALGGYSLTSGDAFDAASDVLQAAAPLLCRQWEAERAERFHVPQIAERSDDSWGVFCAACSAAVSDYVFPCRVDRTDWWANVPASLHAQPGGRQS